MSTRKVRGGCTPKQWVGSRGRGGGGGGGVYGVYHSRMHYKAKRSWEIMGHWKNCALILRTLKHL